MRVERQRVSRVALQKTAYLDPVQRIIWALAVLKYAHKIKALNMVPVTTIVTGTICVLCIFYIIYTLYNQKTVFLVWRNLRGGRSNGFGDKVRSAIATRQFCQANGYRFVLDASDDICSKFLKNVRAPEYDRFKDRPVETVECPSDGTPCKFEAMMHTKLALANNVFIYTNKCPTNDDCVTYKKGILSQSDKEFAKYICEPQDFLLKEVDRARSQLPESYGIQHFRFDDSIFDNDITESDPKFVAFFNKLQSSFRPTDVLMSNSQNFKDYAKHMLGIHTIDAPGKIGHIGNSTDYESVKFSFIEFYIITTAAYVKTTSSYDWVSNFIKWPCLIYDVPLEQGSV